MPQQYQQRNINDPEGSNSIANSVATPDAQLTVADVGKVVFFDTTLIAGTVTLPTSAEAGAGAEITVVMTAGATFAATLAASGADSLVAPAGAPANPAVTDNASFIVRAAGVTSWYVVAGLA